MPLIRDITATFFTTLINRLGIRPPFEEGFKISNVVTPVSIVDTDISIPAILTTQPLVAPVSGSQAAPAVNTVIVDAGAVAAAGNYQITFVIGTSAESANRVIAIARRNAANSADIWAVHIKASDGIIPFNLTITLALNERVVVRMGPDDAASALTTYRASVFTNGPL